jgi:hypothetical protein
MNRNVVAYPFVAARLGAQRHRGQSLRFALLRAVKEGNQVVDDGFSGRIRRDIGGDQTLGLDANRRVGDKAGFEQGFAFYHLVRALVIVG